MALTDKLKSIADAIRGKTGKTDGLTLDQMPGEIEGIETGGGGGSGEFSYTCDAYAVHTKVVTVGENTCSSTNDCVNYLNGLIPGTLIGAFLLSPYGNLNNQFICYEGGGNGTPKGFRFRNGAIGSSAIAGSYDGYLEVGSQYFLISDVLPTV